MGLSLRSLGRLARTQLPHGHSQMFYDIQRCEAPQQPMPTRKGLSNVKIHFGSPAPTPSRRNGIYARDTPWPFDRPRASGPLLDCDDLPELADCQLRRFV